MTKNEMDANQLDWIGESEMDVSEEYVNELEEENRRLKDRVQTLEAQVERLQNQVEDLTKQLKEEKQKKRRQAAPFRKESDSEEESDERSSGRDEGHTGEYREDPDREPDRIEQAVLPDECEHCGEDLTEPGAVEDIQVHTQYQDDVEIQHELVQFEVQAGWCSGCSNHVKGTHPDRDTRALGAAGNNLSDGTRSLANELHYDYGIPVRQVAGLLSDKTGRSVSPGGLTQSARRLNEGLEATYQTIQEDLKESPRVHGDETGWRIGGDNAWLWVLSTEETTVYVIDESRGHEVVLDVLGDEFEGILHSDCFPAYDSLDYEQQKCVAHLLRRAHDLEETKTRRAVCFGRDVKELFQDALSVFKAQEDMDEQTLETKRAALEQRMDGILQRDITEEDNARFQRCLDKQRDHLFRFLYESETVPTNNQAERDLRGAVIARKVSGCSQTKLGARMYSVITSICETARKKGNNVKEIFKKAFHHQRRGDPVALL